MKKTTLIPALLCVIILFASASARANSEKDDAKTDANTPKPASVEPTLEQQVLILNEKVRRMEEIIDRQQRAIDVLTKTVETEAAMKASALASSEAAANASPEPAAAAPAAPAIDDSTTKKVDKLFENFGKFKFSGDLRFRYEGSYDQGFDARIGPTERNRFRMRARAQLAGELNDNFDFAIRFSTGEFVNPISTNQTLGDFFNRKPASLDRFFIRYDSKTQPYGATLIAGKFDYPWKRTELTFDNDLAVEGAAQSVYYKGKGRFKELRVTAFELPFTELSVGKDSYLLGGSLSASFASDNWSLTGATTFENFNRADSIAMALNRPTTQVGGGLSLASSNRLRRDDKGNVIGFAANFNLLDSIVEAVYKPASRYPITILGNYVHNFTDRVKDEKNGFWGEIKFGRLKERGDIELDYTFIRTDQDAVISPFNYSDILSLTNSRANRVMAGFAINRNVFFQFTGIFFRKVNGVRPDATNRTQTTLLLDLNYRF